MRKHHILFAILAIFLLAGADAQTVSTPDSAKDTLQYTTAIGTSDLIVLGVITDAKIPDVPKTIPVNSRAVGIFTFQVEKVLKGEEKTTTFLFSCPLKLYVTNDGTEATPQYAIHGWAPDISKGQRVILFLQRSQGGYALTYKSYRENYTKSFVSDTEEAQVRAAIAKYPVTVSLAGPSDIIVFGTKTVGTVTIKNAGKQSLQIAGLNYEGFYLAKKLDHTLALSTIGQEPKLLDDAGKPKPLTVKAGEKVVFTMGLSTGRPQAWALFDDTSGLLTPIALRAICGYAFLDDAGKPGPVTLVSSSWQRAITGFAPPIDLK